MKFISISIVVVWVIQTMAWGPSQLEGAELPKKIESSACQNPPTIDGVIDDAEWKDSKAIDFEMATLKMKERTFGSRACRLRVMNSANALYVAMKVPDATVNKSLAPLDFDLAVMAFCRGTDVAAGDDKKAVAVGLYFDKHVTTPGKDADDKKQDGKGAMLHDAAKGEYSIEWAFPLDSGDNEDFRAKPGDSLRFSLAYIDAFQFDMRDTVMGAAYPGGLDHAKDWGTLTLAANVKDDGGAAFRGPDWVRKLIEGATSAPANRLKFVESSLVPSADGQVAKVLVEYGYRSVQGKDSKGLAKLYIPVKAQSAGASLPLYYGAGYELDDAAAVGHAGRGFVVVTPRSIEANPLVRTVNPDAALLHITRSLPFVDDAKVVVAGGSAGGYITLMLAAETFPLAAAAPDVPPINWGYNAAYFLQRENGESRKDAAAPKTPVFDVIVPIVQQALKVYGDKTSDEIYYLNSPLSQLSTVTCPVSAYWTTADMLVPIDQVGTTWVRPFESKSFPAGFTFAPEKLMTSEVGRKRLTDVLGEQQYELFVIPEATVKQHLQKPGSPVELPASEQKRWTITILDEGPPEPQVGHMKYAVPWSQKKFLAEKLTRKMDLDQLTTTKLERLLDRYAGREWLPTKLVHLDFAESERADVIRGLRTYCKLGSEYAAQFSKLYAGLPVEKRVLPPATVQELQSLSK